MPYLFRLTFHAMSPGVFRFDEAFRSFPVDDDTELTLRARDAEKLVLAKRYHVEAGGFSDEDAARAAGERLRLRLRVLNAVLGLGLSVPIEDTTSGGLSKHAKDEILKEHGVTARDGVVGLAVWPDDGRHIEIVCSGEAEAYPNDPTYIFSALSDIWPVQMQLDDGSEDALRFLDLALTEQSPRSRFLLSYLAIERMVETRKRSDSAIKMIRHFEDQVMKSDLPEDESKSLISGLRVLHERSMTSELKQIAKSIQTEEKYFGKTISSFISACTRTRQEIAHGGSNLDENNLRAQSDGLRRFCVQLIWTRNGIPSLAFKVPASVLSIREGGFSIRAM